MISDIVIGFIEGVGRGIAILLGVGVLLFLVSEIWQEKPRPRFVVVEQPSGPEIPADDYNTRLNASAVERNAVNYPQCADEGASKARCIARARHIADHGWASWCAIENNPAWCDRQERGRRK